MVGFLFILPLRRCGVPTGSLTGSWNVTFGRFGGHWTVGVSTSVTFDRSIGGCVGVGVGLFGFTPVGVGLCVGCSCPVVGVEVFFSPARFNQ